MKQKYSAVWRSLDFLNFQTRKKNEKFEDSL